MRPKLDALHHAAVPIQISIEDLVIYGDLEVPFNAIGSVIFIHGSGSSRFSSRNQWRDTLLLRCQKWTQKILMNQNSVQMKSMFEQGTAKVNEILTPA